ncbi:hypothetical protein [Microtetraspora sp. NBRC 16547]|uniref:hypothetical protein n=1 Tax=Microtetraspora sp. NBRC 16547 TaxID=3030993 RepID=UPI0024A2416C|nr:hypothetical protein [Microtetraspora sp. NBRC 16547]GLX00973.1 hypothetical protein Misp02_50590 [Microtetraspora sp. NBRC 16547]
MILALASLVNYLAWLGWDQERDIEPDGSLSGPYQPWQVAGLVIVLGILAAFAGRRDHPGIGTLSIAGVMWLSWSVNAALSDNSGLWSVGAVALLPAVFFGVGLVAFLTAPRKTVSQEVQRDD